MRKFALYLILLFFCIYAHATTVAINTVHLDGKTAYVLRVGAFPHENNALQFKFRLSSLTTHALTIGHREKKNNYYVEIGPIDDQQVALELKRKLQDET